MLPTEARWLREALQGIDAQALSPLLNLGSSTAHFREVDQPYIDTDIFAPLRARGIDVVHCDLKQEEGVDIACDLLADDMPAGLAAISPRAVFCTNMLEHVISRPAMARRLAEIVPSGGLLFLTVPRSFPYHPDPIDNCYRPDVAQLAGLFPGWAQVAGAVVADESFADVLRREPRLLLRHIARSVIPWPRPGNWLSALHRWAWLFKPYKVTCLVLRKP
jgi:hypothetical protein